MRPNYNVFVITYKEEKKQCIITFQAEFAGLISGLIMCEQAEV